MQATKEDTVNQNCFESLIESLAALIELEYPKPCEGYLALAVDDESVLQMLADEDGCGFRVFMELGILHEPQWAKKMPELLHANLLMGETVAGSLGFNPDRGEVLLTWKLDARLLDAHKLRSVLEQFLETAKHWKNAIRDDGDSEHAELHASAALRV